MDLPVVTIRAATPDDLETLSRLIAASYRTLGEADYDPAQLAAALPVMSKANPVLLASGTYYVAEIAGEAAGCGGWSRKEPGTGMVTEGVGHIRHFATHPDHLRRGVARLLLQRCLGEAAEAGLSQMRAQATLPAERFYASVGFRRVRPLVVTMAAGITLPVIEMERSLP